MSIIKINLKWYQWIQINMWISAHHQHVCHFVNNNPLEIQPHLCKLSTWIKYIHILQEFNITFIHVTISEPWSNKALSDQLWHYLKNINRKYGINVRRLCFWLFFKPSLCHFIIMLWWKTEVYTVVMNCLTHWPLVDAPVILNRYFSYTNIFWAFPVKLPSMMISWYRFR